MNTYIFGIITGIFLHFAGERFFKFAVKAFKEREVKKDEKLVEIVKQIIKKE